jgi:hypothetical protein
MNKIAFKIFLIFLLVNLYPLMATETSLEIRSAAFFHSSHRFREIYANISGSYQLEASIKFNDCFASWANFDWFAKRGKSEGLHDPTRVNIANISFGIKFPYQFCEQFTAYVGIGPSFSIIWLKNKSQCGHERPSKLAVGGILKTGVSYFISSCVFIDLFIDYLYQPVHFERHVDIGGIKTGAGLGFKF